MALYSIYAYQFSPIVDYSQYLFEDFANEQKEIMNKKNHIFENIIKKTEFIHRNKKLSVQFLPSDDNEIIIFQLANHKTIKLEKKFQTEIETNEPSSHIIIYNNPNIQRIAIEQNTYAFSETEVIAKILSNSFANQLKKNNLTIKIKKEYQEQEFWTLIQEHIHNIQMIRFEFDFPNLPRVSDSINNLIKSLSQDVCSNKTRLEVNSNEKQCLNIDENNEQVKGLAKASSESGNPITLKLKGYKNHIKTGHTSKITEFSELDITSGNIEEIKRIFEALKS